MLTYFVAHTCRDMDPEIFVTASGPKAERAKAICATCPEINKCLAFAIRNEDFDDVIYGGMTGKERKALVNSGGKVIVDYSA